MACLARRVRIKVSDRRGAHAAKDAGAGAKRIERRVFERTVTREEGERGLVGRRFCATGRAPEWTKAGPENQRLETGPGDARKSDRN